MGGEYPTFPKALDSYVYDLTIMAFLWIIALGNLF